jgi:hypothetical protein
VKFISCKLIKISSEHVCNASEDIFLAASHEMKIPR